MKVNSATVEAASIDLTRDEISILINALNEVCNGIHLERESDTRMGCSVEEARKLLAAVGRLGRSMEHV